jgi:putative ABC transport system permease protein
MQFGNTVALAVNPATVMRDFFKTFLAPVTLIMLGVSLLVTIVAAGSILVGIYNSVAARMREIAILRALGATRGKVLTLICVEAGLIGFIGGLGGLILGHLLAGIGSLITTSRLGESIAWTRIGWHITFENFFTAAYWQNPDQYFTNEPLYLVIVILIAVLAGLVPALKAYSTPVATNLSAG